MKLRRKSLVALMVLAAAVGIVALATSPASAGPKPKPCPNCPSTIVIGGRTCTLSACGFDCVYTCPF